MRTLILASFIAAATSPLAAHASAQIGDGDRTTVEPPAVLFDLEGVVVATGTVAGCEVSLRDIRVDEIDARGFWATALGTDDRVFVLPAEGELITVAADDLVNIRGDVRPFTPELARSLTIRAPASVFIYAYTVRPAAALAER